MAKLFFLSYHLNIDIYTLYLQQEQKYHRSSSLKKPGISVVRKIQFIIITY